MESNLKPVEPSLHGDRDISTKHLIILLVLVSLITINPRVNGWNEASRMALTKSLVEQQSFIIDESAFSSGGDKVFIDGHFYSDKPVIPSMLAALVYAPLHFLGLSLDYGWNVSYYFIILLTVKMFWIASILAFRKALTFTSVQRGHITLLVLIYAFASLTFSWSATFSNHSLAGSSLMIGFFYYLKGKHLDSMSPLLWSGLFFGLAGSMDLPTTIFLVGFGILVFLKWHLSRKALLFTAAALLPLLIQFLVNYSIGGTFLPLQINPEFFVFEGSVWTGPDTLSGTSINAPLFALQYGFISLLGPKGFLWYNPLLLLLIPVIIQNLSRDSVFHLETVVIISGSLILMAYYFLFSSNYGGWSYGIRWFVPLLPLIFFYLFALEVFPQKGRGQIILWGLIGCSIIIAGIGLINPWSNQEIHTIPILANLKQLIGIIT